MISQDTSQHTCVADELFYHIVVATLGTRDISCLLSLCAFFPSYTLFRSSKKQTSEKENKDVRVLHHKRECAGFLCVLSAVLRSLFFFWFVGRGTFFFLFCCSYTPMLLPCPHVHSTVAAASLLFHLILFTFAELGLTLSTRRAC